MQPKHLLLTCLLVPMLAPSVAAALVVEIQGKRLESQQPGASCIEIEGEYPGVRVEPSEAGAIPRICYTSAKVNSISILKTTFVAAFPTRKDITVRFEHEFPAGINGKIMARSKLQGFFSTANGLGVPSGDKISFKTLFFQAGDDQVGEPFELTVGDQLDTALFDYSTKEQYLIAGPRSLKGELKFSFRDLGHKLSLPDRSAISIDTGSTFEDKLDTLAEPEEAENPEAAPAEGEGAAPDAATPPAAGELIPQVEPPADPAPLPAPTQPKGKNKAKAPVPSVSAPPVGAELPPVAEPPPAQP
ncbi:hypothetical protein [Methylococcus sp. EFPC2]|uniref:hypothetical protein n=1 Tax=Methylococcus sp. EFPC2 TaxID=2812648 RepID=UPI001967B5C4|nr:hypothetical protein [Methylococcus sp. EFPC2]QSA96721.1 hypothetical protein JWZ97_16145 [Methylococcus sp. EFPC2]